MKKIISIIVLSALYALITTAFSLPGSKGLSDKNSKKQAVKSEVTSEISLDIREQDPPNPDPPFSPGGP